MKRHLVRHLVLNEIRYEGDCKEAAEAVVLQGDEDYDGESEEPLIEWTTFEAYEETQTVDVSRRFYDASRHECFSQCSRDHRHSPLELGVKDIEIIAELSMDFDVE